MDLRAALNAMDEDYEPENIQYETVDVYLLRPEEPREVELKDFTIMKPKNNKMHRLVRYYPGCEISYQAAPPPPQPQERLVTSPGGTTTTMFVVPERTPRHNGGFSNPSRHAEIFRLKRELLKEYFASVRDDDREAAMFDAMIGRSAHPAQQPTNVVYSERFENPVLPAKQNSVRRPLPKYKPVVLGDEDTIELTSERTKRMSLDERVQYVSSLWPGLAPVDDDDEIMTYYGIEVQIISEEEREKELAAKGESAVLQDQRVENYSAPGRADEHESSRVIEEAKSEDLSGNNSELPETNAPSSPELSVKTRSAAMQKLKKAAAEEEENELKLNPIATKQDDWVQCDKCQKWRRLPNQVNVSELPAVWYCKMNRWDKNHNKCSAPEEKLVVLMKGADLAEYRQRKFAQDYIHRVRRMEKSVHHYRYTHMHDDDGERKFVQCTECLKLRPLIGGMDPNKVAEPFVCWMNWDELLASCSAPQGPLHPRPTQEPRQSYASRNSTSTGSSNPVGDDLKPRKVSSNNEGVSGRGGKGSKRTKRKTNSASEKSGRGSGNSNKKTKRT